MTYVLILIAAVGFFALNAPARQAVVSRLSQATASIQTTDITAGVSRVREYVQSKASEFVRSELHRAIDGLLK